MGPALLSKMDMLIWPCALLYCCLPVAAAVRLLVPGGSSRACTYLFDKALRVFTIKVDGEPTFALQLADVLDVKKDLRGTPFAALMDLPPPHAVSGEQLKKKAVSIFYRSPKQDKEVLVLLLPQQYDQERFYACMKILRWALEIEMKPRMNADI
ncbi:hypothetical protein AK812_SmicGene21662 [Symbiodinium microadriaticum]|uniref:Uncharacterized protein n=1 Tax=Symbiodinium microadriaticum TaxID=2951 RepID=A0A1Q9DLU9_SYMMI|nr:hypothetical protein AK812_SmicGene21662 [Symbiodinium microadriaticum]